MNLARDALVSSDFDALYAHIDSAAESCTDTACERKIYRWMLDASIETGNEVLRARAYERIILSHMRTRISGDSAVYIPENDAAFESSSRYLAWSDSLFRRRGDLLPLADALVLSAEVARPDSPGVAISYLARVVSLGKAFDNERLPRSVIADIGRAENEIEGIGMEMASRLESGKRKIEKKDGQSGAADLEFVFLAALGFGNFELAAEAAGLLTEYYLNKGQNADAEKWSKRKIFWDSVTESDEKADD